MINYNATQRVNNLYGIALFALFITSYIPLFILIIAKQIFDNFAYLNWGGLSYTSIRIFVSKFGISIVLFIISLLGLCGCKILFSNLKETAKNGNHVLIKNISNRNSEFVGYIATYIIPFMFQGFSTTYEIFAIFFLLVIIYRIYINSNLLLINPILSFKYSIFEIEYEEQNGKQKNGLIIIENYQIDEDSTIKIYPVGFKLFYAIRKEI
jgi:hypothetical protein